MRRRRRFTPEFKAKVVLEILTGMKTNAEVCREYALKEAQVSVWKRAFVERASLVFQSHEQRSREQARIAQLERLLGQKSLEIEVLKKASGVLSARSDGNGSWS